MPSENFKIRLDRAVETLEPYIRDYLREKNVKTRACRRIVDRFPELSRSTMGCYSIREKCIYIAEKVQHGNIWIENFDVDFALRHESGHAFSYTFRGYEQLSSDARFGRLFATDMKNIPKEVIKTLGFDIDSLEGIEYAREEVFADSFAHSTGCRTRNEYSRLIREHFPSCREYFGDW